MTCVCASGIAAPGDSARPLSDKTLAELEPLQIGQAFLRRGERIGVLLRAADDDTSYHLPAGVAASDEARTASGLEAFSVRNPHYRLERHANGVLKLKPKKPGKCARYLRAPVGSMSLEGPAADVFAAIVRQQNPEIPDGPVTVFPSPIDPGADTQPFTQSVHYSFGGGTLEEALDALILATSGTGWLIIERRPVPQHQLLESYCEATSFTRGSASSGFLLRR